MNRFLSATLEDARQVMDEPADQLIEEVFRNNRVAPREFWQFIAGKDTQEETAFIIKGMAEQYLNGWDTLPEWADKVSIQDSERFFHTHTQDIFLLLGVYALPYCYAAANGAAVLSFSGRMKQDVIQRLSETGQFVFDVLEKGAFTNKGNAFESILKVRLLHATVRFKILNHGKWKSELGQPINQEDMAGTNLAFSMIILDGLRKFGHRITEAEEKSFLHRWRVIGKLLGLHDSMLPKTRKEYFFQKTNIEKRQIRASEAGRALTHQLIETIETSPEKIFPDGFTPSVMRYMLGDHISQILDIPPANWTVGLVNINQAINRLKSSSVLFDMIQQLQYPLIKRRLMSQAN
jgi:hypothetical protein